MRLTASTSTKHGMGQAFSAARAARAAPQPRSPARRASPPPGATAASQPAPASDAASPAGSAAEAPPLPPYSALSIPVYSLSTVAPDGSAATLNLVTYAAPVSLKPRRYALGLYEGTLSRDNMLATGRGLLQARRGRGDAARRTSRCRDPADAAAPRPPAARRPPQPFRAGASRLILGEQHADLFELLGRTSGRQVDKVRELAARGVALGTAAGLPLIADCFGYVELRILGEPTSCGDHEVVICEVVSFETVSPGVRPLYTAHLKELGYL
eukprot:scaffold1.g5542.t1